MPHPSRPAGLSVRLFLALVLLPGIASCGGDSGTEPPPAADRVEVSIPGADLAWGASITATATVYDEEGGVMSGAAVTWSSSDPGVATVTGATITATGVGTATITATAGAATGSAAIDVVQAELALTAPSGPVSAYTLLVARLPASPAVALDDSVYAGVVGEDTVFLAPAGDTALAGLLPDLGDGPRTLAVELGPNARGTLGLEVASAPAIADPAAEIEAAVGAVEAVMDSVAAAFDTISPSLGGDEAAAVRLLLDDIRADVLALDADGKRELAAFLAANPGLWDGSAFSDDASPAAGYELAALTRRELGWKLLGFVATMAGVDASIQLTLAAVRTCRRSRLLRWGCGLAIGVPVAALVANAIAANVAAESVLNTVFKPYEEMVAEVDAGSSLLGPGEVAAESSGGAGPFDLYDGYPLTLGVTQTFATLEASDTDRVAGDVGAFLYALVDFRSYWVDVRLLLEQIARDLGREVSLTGVVADFRDPPRTETWDVAGEELEVRAVSDADVACSIDGDASLRLTCTTDAADPREITVTVGYESDFGTQSLAIQGTLDPGAPPFRYTETDLGTLGGELTLPFAINDAGQVVGYSKVPYDSDGWIESPFLWDDGAMRDLGNPPEAWNGSRAVAINEGGQVLTDVDGPRIWSGGAWGPVLHDSVSGLEDLNDAGQIVGTWLRDHHISVIVQDGAVQFLHPDEFDSWPVAINDAGTVVGTMEVDGFDRAYLWSGGSLQELPPPPGGTDSWAADVNEAGQVVGTWRDEFGSMRGVLWQDGEPIDLGLPDGATAVWPVAIDDLGRVAGETSIGVDDAAFFWQDGVYHTFRQDGSITVYDMNNAGQVVGSLSGQNAYYQARALLWTIDLELLGGS